MYDTSSDATALMIIDMQRDAMKIVPAGREVIPVIKRILDICRKRDISVVHKIRVHRSDGIDVELFRKEMFKRSPFLVEGTKGAEIVDELKPLEKEFLIKGRRFSGFFQTDLQIVLTRLGVKRLAVCGIQTPNCIRSTITDAIAYDYDVVLLKDATGAQSMEVHEANLYDMKNMGVTIMNSDEFLSSIEFKNQG